jgi:hypothetical protein
MSIASDLFFKLRACKLNANCPDESVCVCKLTVDTIQWEKETKGNARMKVEKAVKA